MTTDDIRLMDLQEVREATTLGKTVIYHMIARGEFPAPVRLSARRVAWRAADIQEWLRGLAPVGVPAASEGVGA